MSTANWCRPPRDPFELRGTSSAVVSVNGRTVTRPSGTTVSPRSPAGVTRTPNVVSPARTAESRGGRIITDTDPESPG
nr:hypothetical protein [Streptomyces californicus]